MGSRPYLACRGNDRRTDRILANLSWRTLPVRCPGRVSYRVYLGDHRKFGRPLLPASPAPSNARPEMKVVVILNIASGTFSNPERREALLAALRDSGLNAMVVTVANGSEIAAAVRSHLESGCQTVVAAGGD